MSTATSTRPHVLILSAGWGHARCWCGATSPHEAPSPYGREQWMRRHVAEETDR